MSLAEHQDRFRAVLDFAAIIFCSFLLFNTVEFIVPTDLAMHCNAALNMMLGHGYLDKTWSFNVLKPPLWPFIISLFYRILGVSYDSASWAVRVFCIFSPLLAYALGRRFFSRRTALITALFMLTSYTVSYHSYRHLDVVWPCFVMGSFLVMDSAMSGRRGWPAFLASGLLASGAFLVKQGAIVVVPFPALLFLAIPGWRTRRNFLGIMLYACCVAVGVGGWLLAVKMAQADMGRAMLTLSGSMAMDGAHTGMAEVALKHLKGIGLYFLGQRTSYLNNFILGPFYLVGVFYGLYAAVRGHMGCRKVACLLVLMVPYMAIAGLNEYRVGQLLLFFVLAILLWAHLLGRILDWLGDSLALKHFFGRPGGGAVAILVVGALVGGQFLGEFKGDRGGEKFLERSGVARAAWALFNRSGEAVDSPIRNLFGDEELERLAAYLDQRLQPDESVVVDFNTPARGLYFHLGGRWQVFDSPAFYLLHDGKELGDAGNPGEEPYYADVLGNFWQSKVFYVFMYESRLFELLRSEKVSYLIVSNYFDNLSQYFDTRPGFSKVAMGFDSIKYTLYRVDADALNESSGPCLLGRDLRSSLGALGVVDPEAFRRYEELATGNRVSMRHEDVQSALVNGKLGL